MKMVSEFSALGHNHTSVCDVNYHRSKKKKKLSDYFQSRTIIAIYIHENNNKNKISDEKKTRSNEMWALKFLLDECIKHDRNKESICIKSNLICVMTLRFESNWSNETSTYTQNRTHVDNVLMVSKCETNMCYGNPKPKSNLKKKENKWKKEFSLQKAKTIIILAQNRIPNGNG